MRRLGLGMFSSFSAMIPSYSTLALVLKTALALFLLMIGLTASLGAASPAVEEDVFAIPQDAIRIRIIANSDSSFDQKVKADVRDQVADVIRSWGAMPGTHDEARALIASHLGEVQQTADRTLQNWEVSYNAKVELATVPFPDKVFKGRDYSAGNYEALRITLGGGTGANWWCVLFPPLCLTAATKAEEVPAGQQPTVSSAQPAGDKSKGKIVKTSAKVDSVSSVQAAEDDKPKARFFLWEMLKGLAGFLKSLFS
ncbi:stage II sporulation protein R [Cohnella pontilimi]|uniref:Stage II sporulation protein R n=1 Tax=Cohnella pontilimi TaxID=2564100 RepID=A0A4U0FB19_9BACL|nr:stage II sporulation protein R [Cohnella pontilimi]TJY41871.1 stage II sporulation protein R [Cohnella pontilimi]